MKEAILWVEDYEEIEQDRLLIRCKDCRFFLENWRCVTWHMFVRPDGYCFRAERKSDEEETV